MRYPTAARRSGSLKLGAASAWKRRVRAGAAPTTTGRAGIARRPGSGKRDGKVQRERTSGRTPLSEASAPIWRMWAETQRTPVLVGRRLRGWYFVAGAEAMRKVCGVLVARLQGQSWVPPPSIDQR